MTGWADLGKYPTKLLDAFGSISTLAAIFWLVVGTLPRSALVILLLLSLCAWCWRIALTRNSPFLDPRTLIFVFIGTLLWVASYANLLPWRHLPELTGGVSSPQWVRLLPAGWSDWLYHFTPAPPVGMVPTIYVILKPGQPKPATASCPAASELPGRADSRLADYALLSLIEKGHRTHIAMDANFTGETDPYIDDHLCAAIRSATSPVITAYSVYYKPIGGYQQCPGLSAQLGCMQAQPQGHAMGLVDADDIMRGVPTQWLVNGVYADSLSLLLAKQVKQKSAKSDPFLRLLPPPNGAVHVWDAVKAQRVFRRNVDALNGSLFVIGSKSADDEYRTPFPDSPVLSGAAIQAYAVYDLLSGYYATDCPQALFAALIIGSCLLIPLLASRGWSIARLAAGAGAISLLMLAIAAAAMYLARVWIEPPYPILAVWLCWLALWAQKAYQRRTGAGAGARAPATP